MLKRSSSEIIFGGRSVHLADQFLLVRDLSWHFIASLLIPSPISDDWAGRARV